MWVLGIKFEASWKPGSTLDLEPSLQLCFWGETEFHVAQVLTSDPLGSQAWPLNV